MGKSRKITKVFGFSHARQDSLFSLKALTFSVGQRSPEPEPTNQGSLPEFRPVLARRLPYLSLQTL